MMLHDVEKLAQAKIQGLDIVMKKLESAKTAIVITSCDSGMTADFIVFGGGGPQHHLLGLLEACKLKIVLEPPDSGG